MSVHDVQEPEPGVVVRGDSELADLALAWLQTNVLRVVALRVVPLVMASGVVTGALAWLQDVVGVDLPSTVVAAFVLSTMAGVVATAFAYVKNHGGAVILGTALLQLQKVQAEGQKVGGFKFLERPGEGGGRRADDPEPRP